MKLFNRTRYVIDIDEVIVETRHVSIYKKIRLYDKVIRALMNSVESALYK